MLERFLRRETRFFEFFERHAELTVLASKELVLLVGGGNRSNIAARARRIKEIEHEADVVTHQCVEALHRASRFPLGRDDIYRLITRLDDVVDDVEEVADRIELYEISRMRPECRELAEVIVRAAEEIKIALADLRYIRGARGVLDRCIEINRLENAADAILRGAVARLFRGETDPIYIIKWKEIYENLEAATDRCEDVANVIEGIIVEQI